MRTWSWMPERSPERLLDINSGLNILMRVDELTFPKNIEAAATILRRAGYKQIGNDSSFASVFHKTGDTSVLKLYSANDHAFTMFVDFCRTQTNIHFPRFSRSSIAIPDTKYLAVRTELLQEGDPEMLTQIEGFFKQVVTNKWPTSLNEPATAQFVKEFPQGAAIYLPWLRANPSLGEAFRLLKQAFFGKRGVRFDLHDENMMMRGDTVVLIDPISPISV